MVKQSSPTPSKIPRPSSGHPDAGKIQAAVNEQTRSTGHPLLRDDSRIGEALGKLGQKEDIENFKIEKREEWRECVNRLASQADGNYMLKMMVEHTGMFQTVNNAGNGVILVKKEGLKAFYCDHVRPYLSPENKASIET